MEERAFSRAVSALPTPGKVLKRICAVVEDPGSSVLDITRVLQLDPVIAGKVLRLANSAYIGLPRTVSSVENAVTLLGAGRIHSLVLVSSLRHLKKAASSSFPTIYFWRHSVSTALIAQEIGKSLRRYDCAIDEYELFSSALLHDIGKLIAAVMAPEVFEGLYRKSIRSSVPFFTMENGESAHCYLGGYYAEQWGFPLELKECIGRHHEPFYNGTCGLRVSIVHIADIMAHVLGFKSFPEEVTPRVDQDALNHIGLPLERLQVIARSAIDDQKSIESLMDIV